MAKDDVIDLTDLIQQGSSPQPRGPAPTPPGHVVVPDEKLQMPGLDGVDDLLASLNMTSTPATTEAPPPQDPNAAPSMDLDTILGFKEPDPAPAAAQPAAGKSFDAMLDEAAAAPAAEEAPAGDLDLDALLDEPAAAPAPAPAPAPAAEEAPAGDLDLNALLDEPAAAPAPAAEEASIEEELDPIAAEAQSVVDEAQQELFSTEAAAAANAVAPTVAAQTPSVQNTAPEPAAPEVVSFAADPALADRLTQCETALSALSSRMDTVEAAASGPVAQPAVDPALAARLSACEAALAALSGRVDAVEAAPSAQPAEDTASLRDGVAECGQSLAALSGRVTALEEDARGASDAVLRESLEAACRASETTLRSALDTARQEHHDLLAALPGLVADAVRQAVAQPLPPVPPAEPIAPAASALPEGLREELDRLAVQCRSMAARLDALEKRLDDMQPAFNANIEKAAAAAMSRLLNEQIARLTQE